MISEKQLEQFNLVAKKEIGEENTNIEQALDNLSNVLKEQNKNLKLPPNPDDFLLRFLRASKFDIPRAANQLSQYFKFLHTNFQDIHHLLHPKSVELVFNNLVVTVLKQRDSLGRMVVHSRLEFLPVTPDWLDVGVAAHILMLDFIHRISVDTQRLGIVLLVDMFGYSFRHVRYLKPVRIVQVAKMVAQAFPARIKGVHFVRNPVMFNHIYSIAKPFLPNKLKGRVYFHDYNFVSLHEHIQPEILPEYLGGKVADDQYSDREVASDLIDDDEYYKKLLNCSHR